jgi:hypothetical protein
MYQMKKLNSAGAASLLVILGITAALTIVGFSIIQLGQSSGIKSVRLGHETVAFTEFVSQLRLILSSPQHCRQTFGPNQVYDPTQVYNPPSLMSSSTPILSLWMNDSSNTPHQIFKPNAAIVGSSPFNVGYSGLKISLSFQNTGIDYYSGGPVPVTKANATQNSPGPANPYIPQLLFYGTSGKSVSGYLLPPATGTQILYSYVTQLQVRAKRGASFAESTLTDQIPILITTPAISSAGKILDCVAINYVSQSPMVNSVTPLGLTATWSAPALTPAPPGLPPAFNPFPWISKETCYNRDGGLAGKPPRSHSPHDHTGKELLIPRNYLPSHGELFFDSALNLDWATVPLGRVGVIPLDYAGGGAYANICSLFDPH